MRLKPFDEKDGYRVWLSDHELTRLIETIDELAGTEIRVGCKLGARGGLRRDEAAQARLVDVVQGPGGPNLRVWEDQAKHGQYRETPIPERLQVEIQTLARDVHGIDPDEPFITVTGKTLNRWVKRAGERLYAETGDEGWLHVTYHDQRRTWGTRLLENGVLPSVVMDWGGWKDWETFRKHYLGEFSPEAVKRERSKVDELTSGEVIDITNPQNHLVPVGTKAGNRS